jgi:radical SAM superfamily enzyme YgiQ (UPF0313 family)
MKHKILLYNPKAVFFTMPLALVSIGSCLDRSRYDICIVDGRLDSDPVSKILAEVDDALCLGVTVLTGAPIKDALKVIRAAKLQRPDLPIICGGWHPSLFPTEMLHEPNIDITIQGQGEATFAELLARLADKATINDVSGISFRDADGKLVKNPPRPLLDMNLFPPPDFSLVPVEQYFKMKGQRQLDYITSTGCLFRCAFCADPFVYGRGWQALKPSRVGEEIEKLWRKYQFTDLNFQDETYFTYRKRVVEISEEFLKRNLSFTWAATMRADQGVRLSEEAFRFCIKSGLRRVLIGVESGSPRMIKKIAKDTKIEQVLECAEMCARNNVAVIFSFIVGFPDESDDDVMQTVALIKRLRSMSPQFETPVFYYKPYPGSALTMGSDVELPQTLDEWARFDYVQGEAGPWVSKKTYRFIERFKFYNRYAWGQADWRRAPLRLVSRLRCTVNWFGMPVEKAIMHRLRPEQELS